TPLRHRQVRIPVVAQAGPELAEELVGARRLGGGVGHIPKIPGARQNVKLLRNMGSVAAMRDDRLDAAFDAWLQAQTAALDVVRQATGVPDSDVDLAEGYRWVTRLTRLILDWIVEKSAPLHPQLFDLQDEYKKLLVDNPDVHYTFCVLDDTRSYRL